LKSKDGPYINWMTYLDLMYRLPELLLMRVDKMAMGASVEGRVPFLDHKFIEFALSIPSKLKFKNKTLKYILKKAVRGVIPDEIIDRPKQGFGVPIYEWFYEELGEKALVVLESFCQKTDYLSYEEILKIKKSGNGALLWYLFNFALWWNEYIDEDKRKHEK
jgi:asparagine synthase (glutamine-hydrolysing)